jgi:hypothetical protein
VVVIRRSRGGCVISAAVFDLPSVRRLVYPWSCVVDVGDDRFAKRVAEGTFVMVATMRVDQQTAAVASEPALRRRRLRTAVVRDVGGE